MPIEGKSLNSTPIWDDLGCTLGSARQIWDHPGGGVVAVIARDREKHGLYRKGREERKG
jgi:hypothetical protein